MAQEIERVLKTFFEKAYTVNPWFIIDRASIYRVFDLLYRKAQIIPPNDYFNVQKSRIFNLYMS